MARLERSNRALDASNLELQQFAYVASHDLKAPLRSISGFLQLIRCRYKGQLDAQADEWIDLTVGSAEQLKTLIEALLSYSRVESRARAFAEVSLSEVLDDALVMLDASILDSGARIESEALPVVTADGTQLVQLMQNLIGNAIKYQRSEPPRIRVSAEDCGHEWKVAVRDNGIGIDPKQHERIFEIFRRLHTEHAYPGTGIGLAVCRRVVLRHGGTIWVESSGAVGEGSTFFFTLPKAIVH
jgi:light-regulated signal transduction histidine kinase (bacteriophytochrome)